MEDSQLAELLAEDARLFAEVQKLYLQQRPGTLDTDPQIILRTQRRHVIAQAFGTHLDEVLRPREEAIEQQYNDAMIALQDVPISKLDEACEKFAALTKKRIAIHQQIKVLSKDAGRGTVPPLNLNLYGNYLSGVDAKDPSAIRRCVVGHGPGSPIHAGQRQTFGGSLDATA